MAAVQFYGVDAVLQAAENRNCPGWAIFIGKSMFMKYEGINADESLQMLREHLEMLEPSGTTAIYTLKFFEQPTTGVLKINEKTVCDGGSFNFKLVDPEQRPAMYMGHVKNNSQISELKQEFAEIKQLLATRLQEDEDEKPDPLDSIGAIVVDALSDPQKLFMYINAGRALIGLPVVDTNKAIGNIMNGQQTATQANQQTAQPMDEGERLHNALTTLEKHDRNLIAHLEKLAEMAEREPMKFQMLIKML